MEEITVQEWIDRARKAQQKYYQTHDVQLEMEIDPDDGTEGQGFEDQAVEEAAGKEQGR